MDHIPTSAHEHARRASDILLADQITDRGLRLATAHALTSLALASTDQRVFIGVDPALSFDASTIVAWSRRGG